MLVVAEAEQMNIQDVIHNKEQVVLEVVEMQVLLHQKEMEALIQEVVLELLGVVVQE